MIDNSGHLVPMNQPVNFRIFLDIVLSGDLFQSALRDAEEFERAIDEEIKTM